MRFLPADSLLNAPGAGNPLRYTSPSSPVITANAAVISLFTFTRERRTVPRLVQSAVHKSRDNQVFTAKRTGTSAPFDRDHLNDRIIRIRIIRQGFPGRLHG